LAQSARLEVREIGNRVGFDSTILPITAQRKTLA